MIDQGMIDATIAFAKVNPGMDDLLNRAAEYFALSGSPGYEADAPADGYSNWRF